MRSLFVSLCFALCGCEALQGLEFFDGEGRALTSPVDFGQVELGGSAGALITAFGNQRWELVSVERRSGAPARLLPLLDEVDPVFVLNPSSLTFEADVRWRLEGHFTPPVLVDEAAWETVLALHFRGANGAKVTRLLTLEGRALNFRCGMPSPIHFGGVAPGDTATVDFTLSNLRDVSDTVSFAIEPKNPLFTIDAQTPAGPFTLAPHSEHVVQLTFQPVELRNVLAVAVVQTSAACPRQLINLTGVGAVELLKPLTMDVGWSPVGTTLSSHVDISSLVGRPVSLLSARALTSQTAAFSLSLPQTAPPSGFDGMAEVPGVVSVPITFVPTAEGDFTASYTVATDLPSQPVVQFDVVAHGGAPDVFLPVTQLVLGPDAGPFPGFDVQNVGTLPSTPDSRVSLQFGSPPWEVRAEPGVRPEELCVDTNALSPGPCELPAQLPKLARGETLHLFVRATPSSAGPRRFQVMLHVNDPDEPTPTVDVLVP